MRVVRGRVSVRRLLPALVLGGLAAILPAQVVFADSATLSLAPTHGVATTAVTATYTYSSPAAGCFVGMRIDFSWDTGKVVLGSANLALNAAQQCVAQLTFTPSKTGDSNPRGYIVEGNASQTQVLARAPYTVD